MIRMRKSLAEQWTAKIVYHKLYVNSLMYVYFYTEGRNSVSMTSEKAEDKKERKIKT